MEKEEEKKRVPVEIFPVPQAPEMGSWSFILRVREGGRGGDWKRKKGTNEKIYRERRKRIRIDECRE